MSEGLQLATYDANMRIDANDANSEMGSSTAEEDIASSTGIAMVLSNDNVIYDLVGGVAEWTDQTITAASLPVINPSALSGTSPSQGEESDSFWHDYFEVEDYQGFNIAPPYYYSSDNGIGQINIGSEADTASSSTNYLLSLIHI